MKKKQNKSAGASAFQIALTLALASFAAILFASGLTQPLGGGAPVASAPPQSNVQRPDIVKMVGAVSQDQDLRGLPYVTPREEEVRSN